MVRRLGLADGHVLGVAGLGVLDVNRLGLSLDALLLVDVGADLDGLLIFLIKKKTVMNENQELLM